MQPPDASFMAGSRGSAYGAAMSVLRSLTAFVFVAAALAPAAAEERALCLTREQQRAEIAKGHAVPLGQILRGLRRRLPGDVVRARICQEPGRLVYRVTVLARDGKVHRAILDATNGMIVSEQ